MDRNGRPLALRDSVVVHGRGRLRAGDVVSFGPKYVRVRVSMPTTGRDYELRLPPEDLVRVDRSLGAARIADAVNRWGTVPANEHCRRATLRSWEELLDEAARRLQPEAVAS